MTALREARTRRGWSQSQLIAQLRSAGSHGRARASSRRDAAKHDLAMGEGTAPARRPLPSSLRCGVRGRRDDRAVDIDRASISSVHRGLGRRGDGPRGRHRLRDDARRPRVDRLLARPGGSPFFGMHVRAVRVAARRRDLPRRRPPLVSEPRRPGALARADIRRAPVVGHLAAAADRGRRASVVRPEPLLADRVPVVGTGLRDRRCGSCACPASCCRARTARTRAPSMPRRGSPRTLLLAGRLGSPRRPLLRGVRDVIGLRVVVGRRLPRPGALARTQRGRARGVRAGPPIRLGVLRTPRTTRSSRATTRRRPRTGAGDTSRGARCRLANPRPQESGQHRSMREAILETSGLAGQLDHAIETLREGGE